MSATNGAPSLAALLVRLRETAATLTTMIARMLGQPPPAPDDADRETDARVAALYARIAALRAAPADDE